MLKHLGTSLLCFVLLTFTTSLYAAPKTTLHRGNGAEPETLDVHRSSGVPEANIQRDLFEGLVTEDADGRLIAGVAERWELSENGLEYTFYLRQSAKWSDGSLVTADDFVYAIRRALDPQTASDYAFILWPIKQAEAFSKGDEKNPKALGITAIDKHTLKISLERPTAYFLQLLSHHMAYPVPRKAIEQHSKQWTRPNKLVSNGAYQLKDWQPQARLTLVKNPHYHAADSVKLETVIYYPTEDGNTALKRFRAGELDITDDVPSDQIKWVEKNLPDAFHNSPYIGTYYFALNLTKAPFKDNPALRQALAYAIDRSLLTEKVTRGGELPAWSWVPPNIPNYQAQTLSIAKEQRQKREVLARQLYTEAGYSKDKPLKVEILYNTSDNHKKVAIAVAAMWKKVLGVQTQFRNEEWKVYLNSRNQREFEVIRAGWIGDYNDAYTFLSLFKSDVGEMNPSAYSNTQYDALMTAAENERNTKKRLQKLQEAETLLLSEMPIIPIYFYTTQHLVNTQLNGWKDNVMDIHPSRFLYF